MNFFFFFEKKHACFTRSETFNPWKLQESRQNAPEGGNKASFQGVFWRLKPEGEVEQAEEGMRFSCKEWWFWGKLKLRLKPRSSFSAMAVFLFLLKQL